MTTIRLYNTTSSRLMVDEAGHGVDPATWVTVDDNDPVAARLLAAGLVKRQQPTPQAPATPPEPHPEPVPEAAPDDGPSDETDATPFTAVPGGKTTKKASKGAL